MVGDFIHRNRVAILGLTVLSVAAGLWAASTMPVSIFPEVAFHRISAHRARRRLAGRADTHRA